MAVRFKPILVVFFLSLFCFSVFVYFIHGFSPTPVRVTSDAGKYLKMAGWEDPTFPVQVYPPFRYRIMVPFLVKILPVHPVTGFQIFTVVSLSLVFACFFIFLFSLGLPERWCCYGCILLMVFYYPTIYSLTNPYLVDPLFFLFWVLGLLLICRKKMWELSFVLILGILTKEAVLFLFPAAFFFWFDRTRWFKSTLKAVLPFVGGVVIYLFLKLLSNDPVGANTGLSVLRALSRIPFSPSFLRNIMSGLLLSGFFLFIQIVPGWKMLPADYKKMTVGAFVSVFPLLFIAGDSGRELGLFAFWGIPAVLYLLKYFSQPLKSILYIYSLFVILNVLTIYNMPYENVIRVGVVGGFMYFLLIDKKKLLKSDPENS